MFKKNKTLSIVGLIFAITISIWFDKPWETELSTGQLVVLIINIASGILSVFLLVKALRDGTYGE